MKPYQRAILYLSGLFAALSCWSMATTLYFAWQTPLAVEYGRWVSLGVGIMVMEFVLGATAPAGAGGGYSLFWYSRIGRNCVDHPDMEMEVTVAIEKVNLTEKFNLFSKHWDPKIVGSMNGQYVKLVKFKGPFVWHHHDSEDELFLVVRGTFTMHFRDRNVEVGEGELIIIPRGIEHQPEAWDEVHVLLFEPASTVNTGSAPGQMTVDSPEWI